VKKLKLEEALIELNNQLEDPNNELIDKIDRMETALLELEDENTRLKNLLTNGQNNNNHLILPEKNGIHEKDNGRSESNNSSPEVDEIEIVELHELPPEEEETVELVDEPAPTENGYYTRQTGIMHPIETGVQELATVHAGDEVSEGLADVLRKNPNLADILPSKISRIEKGIYQFGKKKIIVKVINRDVFVRVGGGFMKFETYVQKNHAKDQLIKPPQPMTKEELKHEKEGSISNKLHTITVYPNEIFKKQ